MNWPVPPTENQFSKICDFLDCLSMSFIHCVESAEIAQTGQTAEYSERALASLANQIKISHGQTFNGNTMQNVWEAFNTYGLILEEDWSSVPTDNMTWDEYYLPVPQEALNNAVKPKFKKIDGSANFSLSPVWTFKVRGGVMTHAVCAISPGMYVDSYPPYVNNFDSQDIITYQANLILNPKEKRMLVFFQVKGNATVWALMDGQWVGFSDMTAFNNYVAGRPNAIIQLDQSEFTKLTSNADIFKH